MIVNKKVGVKNIVDINKQLNTLITCGKIYSFSGKDWVVVNKTILSIELSKINIDRLLKILLKYNKHTILNGLLLIDAILNSKGDNKLKQTCFNNIVHNIGIRRKYLEYDEESYIFGLASNSSWINRAVSIEQIIYAFDGYKVHTSYFDTDIIKLDGKRYKMIEVISNGRSYFKLKDTLTNKLNSKLISMIIIMKNGKRLLCTYNDAQTFNDRKEVINKIGKDNIDLIVIKNSKYDRGVLI